MSVQIILFTPGEQATVTLDWEEAVGESDSMGTVTHTVPSPLTKGTEITNSGEKYSTVKVSGCVHGATYVIKGVSTLGSGDVLERTATIRCFANS